MKVDLPITVHDVQRLARDGRVLPASDYHAWQHFVRWEDAVYALRMCYHVVPDNRHPESFLAFGQIGAKQVLRVDFRLAEDDEGRVLMIVTAFPHWRGGRR